mmetsp:Transcript_20166/g.52648  ORF Transcript_20166/g.52648 Transcript_20166/m.52648 type:complete len:233 (-) Transcript_20166:146-844(-)
MASSPLEGELPPRKASPVASSNPARKAVSSAWLALSTSFLLNSSALSGWRRCISRPSLSNARGSVRVAMYVAPASRPMSWTKSEAYTSASLRFSRRTSVRFPTAEWYLGRKAAWFIRTMVSCSEILPPCRCEVSTPEFPTTAQLPHGLMAGEGATAGSSCLAALLNGSERRLRCCTVPWSWKTPRSPARQYRGRIAEAVTTAGSSSVSACHWRSRIMYALSFFRSSGIGSIG